MGNNGGHEFDAESFVRESKMLFPEFVDATDAAEQERSRREPSAPVDEDFGVTNNVLYCQEVLVNHSELADEFSTWDWAWVLEQCQTHRWGLPETNVLFM